jgi:hypothetical protein
MHIGIGAAILILGVLWLATSKAGLKVLGVLALIGCVGGAGFFYWAQQDEQKAAVRARQACLESYKTADFKQTCGNCPKAVATDQGYIPLAPPECR